MTRSSQRGEQRRDRQNLGHLLPCKGVRAEPKRNALAQTLDGESAVADCKAKSAKCVDSSLCRWRRDLHCGGGATIRINRKGNCVHLGLRASSVMVWQARGRQVAGGQSLRDLRKDTTLKRHQGCEWLLCCSGCRTPSACVSGGHRGTRSQEDSVSWTSAAHVALLYRSGIAVSVSWLCNGQV